MHNGPEIIFLPGLDGSGFYFGTVMEIFRQAYPCRLLPYPSHSLTYDELKEYVCANIPPDAKVILVAESFGEPLAIKVADALGSRVHALILCATFCRSPVPAPFLKLAAYLYPSLIRSGHAVFILNQLLFNGRAHDITQRIKKVLLELPDATIQNRLRILASMDVRPELSRLTTQSRKVITIKGPHEVAGTKPVEVANAISAFLKKHC